MDNANTMEIITKPKREFIVKGQPFTEDEFESYLRKWFLAMSEEQSFIKIRKINVIFGKLGILLMNHP